MDSENFFDNCNAQLEQKIKFLDEQQPISFVDITTTGAGGAGGIGGTGAKIEASTRHFDQIAQQKVVTSDEILLDGQLYKSGSIKGMLRNYDLNDVEGVHNPRIDLHPGWQRIPGYRNYHNLLLQMTSYIK
jgi:hypothetical protein